MRYKQNIYTITDEDKNGPNQEKKCMRVYLSELREKFQVYTKRKKKERMKNESG